MNKVKVIIINGFSRSGKNTFVNCVKRQKVNVEEHSTIKTVKLALRQYYMLNPSRKGAAEREFLMAVKQAWIKYNDGPFYEVIQKVENIDNTYALMYSIKRILLFVHTREPKEILKLRNHFKQKCTTIWVDRDVPKQTGDSELQDFDYDFIIKNHGNLTDLDKEASRFLEYLSNERKS